MESRRLNDVTVRLCDTDAASSGTFSSSFAERAKRRRPKEDNAEFETMVHQRRVSGATDKINAIGDAHRTTDDEEDDK